MARIQSDQAASGLYDQAFALEESGDLQRALEIREQLVEYDKSHERFILSLSRSLSLLKRHEDAEHWFRKAIFVHPYSELSSLQLFHFLIGLGRTDAAFEEMKRFESIAHSDDYAEIVKTLNERDTR